VVPVWTMRQRDGAAVDLEAHVPAGGVGHSSAAPHDLVFSGGQQNGETALVGYSHHADRGAQRSCPQPVGARRSVHLILTKYGQPTHNALPFGARSGRPTIRQKPARCAAVPQVALAQVVITRGGITNAPMAISRLRV